MKKLLIILILFLAVQLCLGQNGCNDSVIDFSEVPPPPPPPPPVLPERLPLLVLIIERNVISLDDLESIIIVKDTNILDTLNIPRLRERVNVNRILSGQIDTVKNENEVYYYRTFWGRRSLVKAEKYNSQNLLIESIIFGDDSVISSKTFFDYNQKGELLSDTKYNFWIETPDSVLELSVFYKYKKGRLVEKNAVRNMLHSSAKLVSNIYYNKLGKEIRSETTTFQDDDMVWKRAFEFKYNKKGKLEMYVYRDFETQEKITFEYIGNRIITHRIIGKIKEKYYEYILE